MSFFGFGGGKKEAEQDTSFSSSSSYEEPHYDYSPTSNFDDSPSRASAGPAVGAAEMQQMLMEEQQKALIQQAISKITAIAWDKCSASKPDTSLSSKEVTCIQNVTRSYLDTSAFVVHRLNKSGSSM